MSACSLTGHVSRRQNTGTLVSTTAADLKEHHG
jgi:hypothetical protein